MPSLPPDFWNEEHQQLLRLLAPKLAAAAIRGARGAGVQLGLGINYQLSDNDAAQWARTYTDRLLQQLGSTTENFVGAALEQHFSTPGATLGDLVDALTPKLAGNVARANAIAVTEVTRAYSAGQQAAYVRNGVKRWKWLTGRDELVCPRCGPLNGKIVEIGQAFGVDAKGKEIIEPPFHPNCRCYVAPVVDVPDRLVVKPNPLQPSTIIHVPAPRPPTAQAARQRFTDIEREIEQKVQRLTAELDAATPEWDKCVEEQAKIYNNVSRDERTPEQQAKLKALQTQGNQIADKVDSIIKQKIEAQQSRIPLQREALHVEKPSTVKVSYKSKGIKNEAQRLNVWQSGVEDFKKLVGTGTLDQADVTVKATAKMRSFYNGQVNLSNHIDPRTVIHELGHALEERDPEVLRKALAFLDRRTASETLVPLKKFGAGYTSHEKTRVDKFEHPYMGKDYGRRATEIVSMGMEYMWNDPQDFAQKDPEYFEFIFNLLRGS
jgi:SPP1 gp7 family putative phage head morphogenesis protein